LRVRGTACQGGGGKNRKAGSNQQKRGKRGLRGGAIGGECGSNKTVKGGLVEGMVWLLGLPRQTPLGKMAAPRVGETLSQKNKR